MGGCTGVAVVATGAVGAAVGVDVAEGTGAAATGVALLARGIGVVDAAVGAT